MSRREAVGLDALGLEQLVEDRVGVLEDERPAKPVVQPPYAVSLRHGGLVMGKG